MITASQQLSATAPPGTAIGIRVATAAVFCWLGMVLAISFLEGPLKFRAPGVDVRTGLAIGRIVFGALNRVEAVWAAVIAVALLAQPSSAMAGVAAFVAVTLLVLQLGVVRPRLNRRSDRVLAGEDVPRSTNHHLYVALEGAKVIVLIILGVQLLAS